MKYIGYLAVFAVLVVGLSVPAGSADAACSYNGYINSGGKCAKSWKHEYKNERKERRSDYESFRYDYSNARNQSLDAYIEYLMELIARLEAMRSGDYDYGSDDDFDVVTRNATDVDEEEATLRGRVDFEDEDELTVWFEYGTDRYDLDEETDEETIEDDEDEDFEETIDNLRDGERYYFRAVAENEDGDREYGSVLSFITDEEDNDDDAPVAVTFSADDIEDNSAELRGSVVMNDFNNGEVFFVYGEDANRIEDVEDDFDSYDDVDEDGDDLQKVRVDTDLDGGDTYQEGVDGLDSNTRIYYRICVGYEDEDDDEVLECGSVRDFRTDD